MAAFPATFPAAIRAADEPAQGKTDKSTDKSTIEPAFRSAHQGSICPTFSATIHTAAIWSLRSAKGLADEPTQPSSFKPTHVATYTAPVVASNHSTH